jgi:MFS transporter, Spinster family, sphingosine-1-phosphate transporter
MSAAASAPVLSRGRMASMLAVLLGLNVFSLADRMVLAALIEPIKAELQLSDTQLGMLAGLVFAVVYSTVGLPIARLADRVSRRLILCLSFIFWSAATACCGLAVGFWSLALARLGVALGEAGLGPSAQALIGDYVPEKKRSSALGIFAMGSALGSVLGVALGAQISEAYGWRMAFFALGGAGIGLSVSIWLLPPDKRQAPVAGATPPKLLEALRGFPAPMWPLVFAAAAHLFVSYGMTWNTAFFMRSYDVPLGQAGLWTGLIGGASGIIGALLGGWLGDRALIKGASALPRLCAISVLTSIPFALATYFAPSFAWSLGFAGVMSVLNGIYQAPTYAAVQALAPTGQRATAAAVMILIQNLIGMGLGPVAVGALSDVLTPELGIHALRWALASVFLVNILSAWLFWRTARAMDAMAAK